MNTLLFAAATAVVTNLPTVVVEASRVDATQMNIPSGVQIIARDEIRASGAKDLVDLLHKKAPGVHIRHNGACNPALAEIAMRGYGENGHGRTLVLVDGERLNSPDMNTPNLSRIAIGSVSKVEILGGSQAVLHGDGASAGVINIITEPQDYEQKTYAELHGGSWGSFGGAVGSRGGIAEDGVKYWADGSWDRSDGYRNHSGYDIWNVSGGIRKDWENGTYLRLSAFFNDSQYDLPGALGYWQWKADPRQASTDEDRYHRTTYGINATFNAQVNEENALRTTTTFSNRKMWAYSQASWGYSDYDYDIYSYKLSEEWINTTELFGFDNRFILGVQYSYDSLYNIFNNSGAISSPDYNRQMFDVFAQDTFSFTDWLALQFGGRYSRAWSFNENTNPNKRQNHLGAFDAALIANPSDDSKVYVKWSRTYRNPFLDEFPYDPRTWAPMGLLDPEQGWSAEIGFEWNITDEFTAGADAYYSWLEDEIFYDAVHGANVNSDDETVRRGFDAHIAWEKDKLAGISIAFSYVKATFDGGVFGRNMIPLVPETSLSLNGRAWLWDDCYIFGGYRFQSDMYSISDFNNDYGTMSWYGVFHLGATYEPTFAEWTRGFKVSVTVDNLFDERYCDYASYGYNYWPAAGRSFMISVRYEF